MRQFKAIRLMAVVIVTMFIAACSSKEETAQEYLTSGISLYEDGELNKSRLELRNTLQVDPKQSKAYYFLALIEEKKKNPKGIFNNMSKVEQLDPTHLEAKIKLGELFIQAREFEQALSKADQALTLNPQSYDAMRIKAAAFLGLKQLDEAQTFIDKAQALKPDDLEMAALKSLLYKERGDFQSALRLLNDTIARSDDKLQLLLVRLAIHQQLLDYEALEQDYRELSQALPDQQQFILSLAKLLKDRQRYAEAERELVAYSEQYPKNTTIKQAIIEIVTINDESRAQQLLDGYIVAVPDAVELRFYRINRLLKKQNWSQAKAELSEIIGLPSADEEARLEAKALVAEIQLLQGNESEALVIISEILAADKLDERGLLLQAKISLKKRDFESAIADLRVVLRNNPGSEGALVLLGGAYLESGARQLADDTFRQVLAQNPSNMTAAIPVVKNLLASQDLDRSEQILQAPLNDAPNQEALLALMAQIKLLKKDWLGLAELVSDLKVIGRNDAYADYLSGRIFQGQQQYELAVGKYRNALELRPELSPALQGIAASYLALDQENELLLYLADYQQNQPDQLQGYAIAAQVHRQAQRWASAIKEIESGLFRQVAWMQGYSAIADYQLESGDSAAAIATYRRGLKHLEDSVYIKALLASLLEREGRKDEALILYENILAQEPDNEPVINNLVSLLTDQFNSEVNLQRAVMLSQRFKDSKQPYFIDTYAWALVKSGELKGGESLLQKAISIAPNVAVFQYHYGVALIKLQRLDEAKNALVKADKLATSDKELADKIRDVLAGL